MTLTQEEVDAVIRKFWDVGYAGLTAVERQIIAFAYTVGGCHVCKR